MNVASIDIGSNTVLLLIAKINFSQSSFQSLLNEYRIPRISNGITKSGKISDTKIIELIEVLREYQKICKEFGVSKYIIKATNAMRIAENSSYIVERINEELGLKIEVISGEQEANLSYAGAKSSFSDIEESFVLDIGGGSTEFIHGNKSGMLFRKSFPKGAVNLTEENIENYPPNSYEIKNLDDSIENTFNTIKNFKDRNIPLIAVAGTPTTLACIKQNLKEYAENRIEKFILRKSDLEESIEEFRMKLPQELLNNYGKIIKGREDVILAGTKILLRILNNLNTDSLYVSGRGLRYGSIVQLIEELQNKRVEFP
jgi:exopolyphosphatase/guanosine-5'-triphosphate,3'-diphosphate pyrophosphatase